MEEAGEESLVQHLARDNAPAAVSEDNAGEKRCSSSSTEDMDNKENVCMVSESRSDLPAISQAMPQARRPRRGGGCNLRKSLVWNKAFFTEEGVLNPLELSILSRSATKSSARFLTGSNRERSPLTSFGVGSRVNLDNKVHLGSALDAKKDDGLLSTLDPSGQNDSVPHADPEKTNLAKGVCRNIPWSPAAVSQKRLATNTPNPASKLPKLTSTKLQVASLTPARCSVSTKRISNQNAKPANIEPNTRSKSSSLALKKALNYSTSSSRSSEHAYEKKIVNETSELPSSADKQTTDMAKCTSYLRPPRSHLPPNRLSTAVGSSNFEKVANSVSQNAGHVQAGHPPVQVQAKPSGLRMPTPSLGFFCQAKFPAHALQLQDYQESRIFDHGGQPPVKSNSLKHMDDLRTVHASNGQGQPGGSGSTGTKVRSVIVSTPFTIKSTDCSGNSVVPSVTHRTLSPDITREASKGEILRSGTKSQISRSQENHQEQLHSDCLVDECNIGKQSGKQGSICGTESPNNIQLSMNNSSSPVERKFVNSMTQAHYFKPVGGMCLTSEDSGRHELVNSNVISQKCSPKQRQLGDCVIGEPVMHQQWEYARDTSTSAGNKGLPDEKNQLMPGLSFGNNGKCIERCPLLEVKTPLRSCKTQIAGNMSSQLVYSSTENMASSVEGENTECAVNMGQHGLNCDTIILEEVHSTESEKCEFQSCDVSYQKKGNEIAFQDESEVILDKQEPMEKSKQFSISVNQLKAPPFSDEWVVALEAFGEDILQMKTGAVQNSPPDKPTPELGPWSPVKRKNQDIGPCECTKYIKEPVNLQTH